MVTVQRLYHTLPAQSTPSSVFIGHPPTTAVTAYISITKNENSYAMDKEAWRWRCPAVPLAWGCALPMADLLGPLEPPARQPLHDRRRADRREARRGRTAWYRSRGGEGLAGLSPRPEALADEPGPARGLE